jgi:hypothetical protein
VDHLTQLVGILLIAMVAVAVVTPDFDLQSTIVSTSRLVQHSLVVAAITLAGIVRLVPKLSPLLRRVLYHISGYHSANLIDLNCTRLC